MQTHEVGDHCLIIHDHNRPVNVFRYNPTVGLKHACIVDDTVIYNQLETGQIVPLLIHQVIEMKDLHHHSLCHMQCHMNSVLIDEVQKFLTPIPSEAIYDVQIVNPFDATQPIIIPLKVTRVTSYFGERKPTQDQVRTHCKSSTMDLSSLQFRRQGKTMFDYRGWFVRPNIPSGGQLFINSIK